MDNSCVPLSGKIAIAAPLETGLGSRILATLAYANGSPAQGLQLHVADPAGKEAVYLTDSRGAASFNAETAGYYSYSLSSQCPALSFSNIIVTSVFSPDAPPTSKKLVIPVYVDEPSAMTMHVLSLGKPQQAGVDILDPNQAQSAANTSANGTYEQYLPANGRYVFTVYASGVKSLSATISLVPGQQLPPPWGSQSGLVIAVILLLFALSLAWLARGRIMALFRSRR